MSISIFNSTVVPFGDGHAGVFRYDDTNRRMRLHAGFSRDGIHWNIEEEDIRLTGAHPEIGTWVYGYDPRVVWIDDRYYITWCNGYHGPATGRLAIYYGCADTVTSLAFGYIDDIIAFTKRTSIIQVKGQKG